MKIHLDQSESDALDGFNRSGANYVKVIEKIFKISLEDMKDINNIDPKSNMGLNALARQNAYLQLKEIKDLIFPSQAEKKSQEPGAPVVRPYK